VGVVVLGVAATSYLGGRSANPADSAAVAAAQPDAAAAAAATSSEALMQSTGVVFAQSADYKYAHEIYPAQAADATKTLGAFSFSTINRGGGIVQVTLTNGAEGYLGQSVVVGPGQTIYFVEKSSRDDTDQEDSSTRDDYLVAVDAQGMVLQ